MVEQIVRLCDKCKKYIAIGKCHFCEEDICGSCCRKSIINYTDDGDSVTLRYSSYSLDEKKEGDILICNECKSKFGEAFEKLTREEIRKLGGKLFDTFTKSLTISKLEEREGGLAL